MIKFTKLTLLAVILLGISSCQTTVEIDTYSQRINNQEFAGLIKEYSNNLEAAYLCRAKRYDCTLTGDALTRLTKELEYCAAALKPDENLTLLPAAERNAKISKIKAQCGSIDKSQGDDRRTNFVSAISEQVNLLKKYREIMANEDTQKKSEQSEADLAWINQHRLRIINALNKSLSKDPRSFFNPSQLDACRNDRKVEAIEVVSAREVACIDRNSLKPLPDVRWLMFKGTCTLKGGDSILPIFTEAYVSGDRLGNSRGSLGCAQ